MGRRKKEELGIHRDCIAAAAEQLFAAKGISATTMDEVAKAAQYSKATLYVYFKNKEELVGALVLKSMKMLYQRLSSAIAECSGARKRYDAICAELVNYYKEYPFYFEIALGEINVDFDAPEALPVEREIFEVGERLTGEIAGFLLSGIEEGEFCPDLQISQTVFLFWAGLSGVIVMSEKKCRYIEQSMGIDRQQFLETCFDRLYRSVQNEKSGRK